MCRCWWVRWPTSRLNKGWALPTFLEEQVLLWLSFFYADKWFNQTFGNWTMLSPATFYQMSETGDLHYKLIKKRVKGQQDEKVRPLVVPGRLRLDVRKKLIWMIGWALELPKLPREVMQSSAVEVGVQEMCRSGTEGHCLVSNIGGSWMIDLRHLFQP